MICQFCTCAKQAKTSTPILVCQNPKSKRYREVIQFTSPACAAMIHFSRAQRAEEARQ